MVTTGKIATVKEGSNSEGDSNSKRDSNSKEGSNSKKGSNSKGDSNSKELETLMMIVRPTMGYHYIKNYFIIFPSYV